VKSNAFFGEVINEEMRLSQFGKIVRDTWNDFPNHNHTIELNEYEKFVSSFAYNTLKPPVAETYSWDNHYTRGRDRF